MVKTSFAAKRILRPPEVRGANRAAVLHLLQQHDYLSRADVARREWTFRRRYLPDCDRPDQGRSLARRWRGEFYRRASGPPLALDPRRVVFGVEIQNWETRCAISTMHGRIVETRRFRTPASAEETLDKLLTRFILQQGTRQ